MGSADTEAPPRPQPPRGGRRKIVWGASIAVAAGALWRALAYLTRFPPDTAPEGAYLRIAFHVGQGDPKGVFAYLEDAAQHAAFTIRDYRREAREQVLGAFPEPDRTRLAAEYASLAGAADGSDAWQVLATERGFLARLRRDMSGIAEVEIVGDRATVVTAMGTRYPFRRRENGIWGLTLFTAELAAEAERAARDAEVIRTAAGDYARARAKEYR